MLLVDSNIFIYARGSHAHSPACRDFVAAAADHSDWFVPLLVLLELTHYYGDGGTYARRILAAFPAAETTLADFDWAAEHAPNHEALNDHVLLHTAHRLDCDAIATYDDFFTNQSHFSSLVGQSPSDALDDSP